MKLKDFFKSNSFRCILVLLCIVLVSGGLLSILNDLLNVSPEEKLNRVIASVYDDPSVTPTKKLLSETKQNEYGVINEAYLLSDGNLVVNATGDKGYKNGTVTVWVVVEIENGSFSGIGSVKVASYEKQTLMSQFGGAFFNNFTAHNDALLSGEYFDTTGELGSLTTGATFSSNAINRAVNATVYYVMNEYKEVNV